MRRPAWRRPPTTTARGRGSPAGLLALAAALGLVLGGGSPARAAGGEAFGWPVGVPHPVLRPFAAPATAWGPGHRGVDLGAPAGAEVVAAGSGTVRYAAVLAGRGVVVVAHRGGLRTTYEPVVASVRVGAQVSRGEPLGRLALVGGHCLPRACLHWGALSGARYLDPLGLLGLRPGPVRLLPLAPADVPAALGAPLPLGGPGPVIAPVVAPAVGPAVDSAVGPAVDPAAAVTGATGGTGARRPRRPAAADRSGSTALSVGAAALLGGLAATGVWWRRRRAPPALQGQSSAGRSRASRS
jgi:murein DD-endopeptidase MepM/ murein hydrolase activator NlpD